jgi:hypothetical protein
VDNFLSIFFSQIKTPQPLEIENWDPTKNKLAKIKKNASEKKS